MSKEIELLRKEIELLRKEIELLRAERAPIVIAPLPCITPSPSQTPWIPLPPVWCGTTGSGSQ